MGKAGTFTFACWTALSSTSLLASCTSTPDFPVAELPADLRESANCISAILLATAGITAVEITAWRDWRGDTSPRRILLGDEGNAPLAVVSYRFLDQRKAQRSVSFPVFKHSGLAPPGIAFDVDRAVGFDASSTGGPVTFAITQKFGDECHAAGLVLFT